MGDEACPKPAVQIYMTSVSSSSEVKGRQNKIKMILESKKINFQEIDIASDGQLLIDMRNIASNQSALPPQLAKGGIYIGDYTQFEQALEDERLNDFLKL